MSFITFLLRRATLLALGCATLIGFAPLISVVIAGTIASRFGCRLDEGDAHPCLVLGHDLGDILYTMGVAGWLMLGTWPLMIATVVLWIVVAGAALVRWVGRQTSRRDPGDGAEPSTSR
jgi:hypothetical protein